MEILDVKNLSFTYPASNKAAINDISFTVNEGELVLLCGNSGSGKTTLLRCLKPQVTPAGKIDGNVLFCGKHFKDYDQKRTVADIGFCSQSPVAQQVCDTVMRELAFGLENIGTPQQVTAKRIAEISMYFGLEKLLSKKLAELSGGERQIVNLAAVCALHPRMIILDEPTAQLSPVSAASLINLLDRMRRELGITVVLTEHRTQELFERADKVVLLDGGKIFACGTPEQVAVNVLANGADRLLHHLPAPAMLYAEAGGSQPPVTLADGREWLREAQKNGTFCVSPQKNAALSETAVRCKNVCFAYERSRLVLNNLNFSVAKGEFLCILGANGAGKTTLLRLLGGAAKPLAGKITYAKGLKSAYLPQNVAPMFVGESVESCLDGVDDADIGFFGLRELLSAHPYDLSGGELQRAALCRLMAKKPDVLLLDEPTKGLDNLRKSELAGLLFDLCQSGKAVICVTHDIEFAAEHARHAAFLSNGEILSHGERLEFFSDNVFCSTAVSRLTRGIIGPCVAPGDVRLADEK